MSTLIVNFVRALTLQTLEPPPARVIYFFNGVGYSNCQDCLMKRICHIIFFALFSSFVCNGAETFSSGTGHFSYNMPSGEITDTLKVFYHIPAGYDRKSMPVVIGFHGNDRDCSYWVETWKEYADKNGFMFFIPWFTHESFPTRRYQETGVKDTEGNILPLKSRTSALVDSLICHILKNSGSNERKVTIFGHSAGGQFVHRFMLLNNSPYVKKAIIGNPGWFTFPSMEEEYSYGIKDLSEIDDNRLRDMLSRNIILQLAEGDTIRESFLRKTPEADRQGRNRLERGNKYFETLKSIADKKHWDFNWRKVYVPNVGHDAVAMSRYAAENLLTDSVSISGIKAGTDWLHRYDDEIESLVNMSDNDTDTICDALFVGSSSIRLWHNLKDAMQPLNVKNRGYGGAMMRDMMINYHRIMAHYQPKTVVMYCDNDICGWTEGDLSVSQVSALYKSFINKIQKDYPATTVYFLSIKHSLSRENLRGQQHALNAIMKEYSDKTSGLVYVDMTTPLLDERAEINDALFMDDHLHLNPNGYDLWNNALKPLLMKQSNKQQ